MKKFNVREWQKKHLIWETKGNFRYDLREQIPGLSPTASFTYYGCAQCAEGTIYGGLGPGSVDPGTDISGDYNCFNQGNLVAYTISAEDFNNPIQTYTPNALPQYLYTWNYQGSDPNILGNLDSSGPGFLTSFNTETPGFSTIASGMCSGSNGIGAPLQSGSNDIISTSSLDLSYNSAEDYFDYPTEFCALPQVDFFITETNICDQCVSDPIQNAAIQCCCCPGYEGLPQQAINYFGEDFSGWGGPNQCDGGYIPPTTGNIGSDGCPENAYFWSLSPNIQDVLCSPDYSFAGTGEEEQQFYNFATNNGACCTIEPTGSATTGSAQGMGVIPPQSSTMGSKPIDKPFKPRRGREDRKTRARKARRLRENIIKLVKKNI